MDEEEDLHLEYTDRELRSMSGFIKEDDMSVDSDYSVTCDTSLLTLPDLDVLSPESIPIKRSRTVDSGMREVTRRTDPPAAGAVLISQCSVPSTSGCVISGAQRPSSETLSPVPASTSELFASSFLAPCSSASLSVPYPAELETTIPEQHHDNTAMKIDTGTPSDQTVPFDSSEFPWVFDPVHEDEPPPTLNLTIDLHEEDVFYDQVVADSNINSDEGHGNFRSPRQDQDVPLYTGASVSVLESLTAILSFVQCEKLSGVGLGRLLSLITLLLPKPNLFTESTHNLFKLLENIEDPVKIHYFCSICYAIRSSQNDICNSCTDESKTVCYFIQFPLVPQVEQLFKRPDFVQNIKYKHLRQKENPDNIEDIYDGEIYKDAERRFLKSPFDVSFMWNTDGLQVFESTALSLWPFYLAVNELPPGQRFLTENMLIAGLWGSLTKPHPNLFLLPIYQDLQVLKSGVDLEVAGEAEKKRIHALCICGSCDSPARALFFNQKTHSGFFSCPKCLCRGEKPDESPVVFPYEENPARRNMTDYEEYVKLAVEHKLNLNKNPQIEERCFGIKGPSVLAHMVDEMFSSTAIDSMHCVYLGVTRQLMHLWFDPVHKQEAFSMHGKIKIVNKRLENLNVPHFLQRVPHNVDKLVYWKASELRNFLLYLSLIVLDGVLNTAHFEHLMLLVHGVSLLNSSSISDDDLQYANLFLHQFVEQFAGLYGPSTMSHNVHLLLHLAECVRSLGGLWVVSCFKFEDMNGRLLNFIHGTRHTGLQIYSNLCIAQKLPLLVRKISNDGVKSFCIELPKRFRLKMSEQISSGIFCVGVFSSISSRSEWVLNELVANLIISPSTCNVVLFQRLMINGLLLVSSMYSRGVRDSTCVKYCRDNNVKYGKIECFVKCTCLCTNHLKHIAIVRPLVTNPVFVTHQLPLQSILQYDPLHEAPLDFLSLFEIQTVVFRSQVDNQYYLSVPLNKLEME